MKILNYLWPENDIARWIVGILVIIWVFWAYKMITSWFTLCQHRSMILKCGNIDRLVGELVQLLRLKEGDQDEEKKKGKNSEEEGDRLALMQKGIKAFSSFCREKNIDEKGVVARHLRTIFEAGIQDSRLDVGELIKHTHNELFRPNGFLKSLLASFIVIGLLGTLIGLADSLAALSPVLGKGIVERTSVELTSGLSTLFTHLKTAFAPSIWGVMFTVIGVIVFSCYLHWACLPVKESLEKLTLTVWVPRLFLTESQRYLGTLKLGGEQIQKNLEAIDNVAKMHQNIRPDVEELTNKLKSSSQILGQMNQSASEITHFTTSFVDGVTKLSAFQGQVQSLYQEMIKQSEAFQQRVQASIEHSQQFQSQSNATFEYQNRQLKESFQNLDSYEKAYVEQRQQIDAKLQQLLDTARKTYETLEKSMEERNREVLGAIEGSLMEKLTDIQHTLHLNLDDISKRFNSFDGPIKGAAERISTTFVNFDTRTKALTDELRIDLNDLFSRVEGYSNQLSVTNQDLSERSKILGGGLDDLSQEIKALDDSFKVFDNFARSKKDKTEDRVIDLTRELQKEFSRQNEGINRNVEKLFKRFEKSDEQMVETGRIQAEQAQTLGKNLSDFSDSIRVLQKAVQVLEKTYQHRDEGIEGLRSLGDLAGQMSDLIFQLRDDSRSQKEQNKVIAGKMEKVSESLVFLAKSIGTMTGKKVPKKYLEKEGSEPIPVKSKRPLFKRIFGRNT